ncbi:hypothetical protein [Singulisphaera sp. PoT]|uniref:hypothetical protein n=1 Tax=Singulisphaera sp. PoT TaxID=3411797 RepID=UPI003BF58FF9
MADADDWQFNTGAASAPRPAAKALPPIVAFQKALERYEPLRLLDIQRILEIGESVTKPRALGEFLTERLAEARMAERLINEAGWDARIALSLFAISETSSYPLDGLIHSLACLGVDAPSTLRYLTSRGVFVLEFVEPRIPMDLTQLLESETGTGEGVNILAHPALVNAVRTTRPEGVLTGVSSSAKQIREADGLELILRLGAVWQRVQEAPLRRTQQGSLYKRDRDRLEDDSVLAGPIADMIEPLPDMVNFWLAMARGIGLLIDEAHSDRIVAADAEYWVDNAIHMSQMLAIRWLGLRNWHEQGGMQEEGSEVRLAIPYIRLPVLLWLATLAEDQWVAVEDLAAHLYNLLPNWDRVSFLGEAPIKSAVRPKPAKAKGKGRGSQDSQESGPLEAILLGPAYQLGLIRTGEEDLNGRRVVQLSPLARYILALGPYPPPRPSFEHFLFVQPNFEIIAYRQGLTPTLIGHFSRFARWSQLAAALELKLTAESVYIGLEGGMTPAEILDRLSRHSSRPLPTGVAEALRTWAGRRERVSFHATATLIEFACREDLDAALAHWAPGAASPPVVITDRLLLVEDESTIPFARFRLAGSRDYRRAPEICVEVEPDGVSLALDLGRSDLLVDAELTRFADEQPLEPAKDSLANPRRRFRVSLESLARASEHGLTGPMLAQWYLRRTGTDVPPAVQLLLFAADSKTPSLATSRPLVLHTPTSELLDGLLQHPQTRDYLGDRLGPTSIVIIEEALPGLRAILGTLGVSLADPQAKLEVEPLDRSLAPRSTRPGPRPKPGSR